MVEGSQEFEWRQENEMYASCEMNNRESDRREVVDMSQTLLASCQTSERESVVRGFLCRISDGLDVLSRAVASLNLVVS